MISKHDLSLLHSAVRMAIRGHGSAEPNPLVGCIITGSTGTIVGSGYHRHFGKAHAEVNALNQAGVHANGGTAYITLEPCNHHGQTPPCSQALLAAGINRVVIGVQDQHPTAGGGGAFLSESGIKVDVANDSACQDLIAPFAHRVQTGLPWIICKWAQTPEGCIETPTGDSPWISSMRSQSLVHRERGRVDAIVVGVGTVVADNPRLTVRGARKRRTPLRVVIDPTLRTPPNANILDNDAPTLVAHARDADQSRLSSCLKLTLPTQGDALDLAPLFRHLVTEFNATNVIVEGGATLFQHIFDQQLANELWIFTSPNRRDGLDTKYNINDLIKPLTLQCMDSRYRNGDHVTRFRVDLGFD